jgi:hypothetical protein
MRQSLVAVGPSGLSCYTANLLRYLAVEWDADAILARSVRLAVRIDQGQLAFSHHAEPLDELPDGTRLRYAGAAGPAAALDGLATELRAYGRALTMVDSSGLPWSPTYGRPDPAPHWLLVVDGREDAWHVVDCFAGLLPTGPQEPYEGWVSASVLRAAMALPAWRPEQARRNALAFGLPVDVPVIPPGGASWLRRAAGRSPDEPVAPRRLPGQWLLGDAEVLPFLAGHFAADGAGAASYLDDCWAAAGHRAFAHRWRLSGEVVDQPRRQRLRGALDRWEALPRALRFAVESAQRGRPRPSLAGRAFDAVLRAEADLATHQPSHVDTGGSS